MDETGPNDAPRDHAAPDDAVPDDAVPDDAAPDDLVGARGAPPAPEGDALPEELDVTAFVGPYVFPDIRRRRIAGTLYAVVAAACLWAGVAADNGGLVLGAALLGVAAAYHFAAAWPLQVDQTEALAVASRTVGFPVGHASAQLAWRGLRSRPTWRILVYSADEPPSVRGLVELDAVDASVLGEYTEANPEDWSQYRS